MAEQESDINAFDGKNGFPPTFYLASREKAQLVVAALEASANVTSLNEYGFMTLCMASKSGSKDVIIILFDAGSKINYKDPEGDTPLLLAARESHVEILKISIARGAYLSIKNDKGLNVLEMSSDANREAVVVLLSSLPFFKIVTLRLPQTNCSRN